jgi:hypothetical protein
LCGCVETGDPAPADGDALIALEAFSALDASDDPLWSHRPVEIDCSPLTGWFVEGDHVELDTGRCNYVAIAQPALTSADAGAHVTGSLSHFDLTSEDAVADAGGPF